MKKYQRSLFFALLLAVSAQAQDAHFSQMSLSGSYLNPALTGNFSQELGLLRATALYRNQWNFEPSYRDFLASLDKTGQKWRLGGSLWGQNAGKNSLQTIGGRASVAIRQTVGGEASNLLLGVSLGFVQQKFDPLTLTFGNQYDSENGYSASHSTGENFALTSKTVPDFAAGLAWKARFSGGGIEPEIGLSWSNLNQPTLSFYADQATTRALRTAAHACVKIRMTNEAQLSPYFQLLQQDHARSTVLGADLTFAAGDNTLTFGAGIRRGDALIFRLGLDFKNQFVGLALDANNSDLKTVSKGRGAWELAWVSYFSPQKREKKEPLPKEKEPCRACEVLDSDGDGVTDARDRCPDVPGLLMFAGCPDDDGDGIPDQKDACPSLPGTAARGGCPEIDGDSDGDGIRDAQDDCPYIRGLAKFRGCPDSDGDDIPDLSDHCPFLKGVVACNGCPCGNDARPVAAAPNLPAPVLVEFDTDKSNIKPQYFSALDELAAWLDVNLGHRVFIAGHTDAEGTGAYNFGLGNRRAQALRDYLLKKGVLAHRTEIISYGENMPKEQNGTDNGRARNRRAEAVILGRQ